MDSVGNQVSSLPEPETKGARRVSDALTWLADQKYVKLERKHGQPPTITLLSPKLTGTKHIRPKGVYVTVPVGLWREGWMPVLSARALTLLIILLDLQGGRRFTRSSPPWLGTGQMLRYGISQDTWTRAQKELVSLGLLEVGKKSTTGLDWDRARNTYWIDKTRLDTAP